MPSAFRLLPLVALSYAARAGGQAPHRVGSSANAWVDVTSDLWLTPVYDVLLGAKVQRAELGAAPQQTELRAGLLRPLGRRFRVAVGGSLLHNSPYSPFPAAAPFGERRLWQYVLQDQRVGRVALQHRYRLEERWVERPVRGGTADPEVVFTPRVRYQLRASLPVGSAKAEHPRYVAVWDELFKSVGPHASSVLLDQNRVYAGVGVRWSAALRGEVGYLNQLIVRANGRQVEHGHTVQLTLGVTRPARRR